MYHYQQNYLQMPPQPFLPHATQHSGCPVIQNNILGHPVAGPTYDDRPTFAYNFTENCHYSGLTPEQQNWVALVKQRKTDEDFLNSFVRMKQSEKPVSKITIANYKRLFAETRNLLEELKNEKKQLEESKGTLTEEEWISTVDKISLIKERLAANTKKLEEDGSAFQILTEKRNKKRAWLKRKREQWEEHEKQEMEKREKIEKAIDEWRNKQIEEELQKKRDKETKQEADLVLGEVLRKKSEAKQCVKLVEMLKQLREARLKTMQNTHGFRSDPAADERFSTTSAYLVRLMETQLRNYDNEEATLRDMLEIQ